MEKSIENMLDNPEIRSQNDLKQFISEVQSKITIFEKQIYGEETDPVLIKKIKGWRQRLLEIVKNNRELPENENSEEKKGIDALKLLNKQINNAELNQQILIKSTLKLASLDLSTGELDKVIVETRKKIEQNIKREKIEYRRLLLVFFIFLCICFIILIDKYRLKRIDFVKFRSERQMIL